MRFADAGMGVSPNVIVLRHCERSEAIHASASGEMDSFATLALTKGRLTFPPMPSFRDGPQDQTRNFEIPGSMLCIAPE
jgi:hypothetical protein